MTLHPLCFIPFLHQTTTISLATCSCFRCVSFHFYIKPQLDNEKLQINLGCVSFHFYIKPQRRISTSVRQSVVFHSISTSNHNPYKAISAQADVVFHSISTSNHNCPSIHIIRFGVVFHSISTSNHNLGSLST